MNNDVSEFPDAATYTSGGKTIIAHALSCGQLDTVGDMTSRWGLEIPKGNDGDATLRKVVSAKDIDTNLVESLLQSGANPIAVDKKGKSALKFVTSLKAEDAAAKKEKDYVLKILLKNIEIPFREGDKTEADYIEYLSPENILKLIRINLGSNFEKAPDAALFVCLLTVYQFSRFFH